MIKLWDVRNGKERAALNGHDGPIHSLAFSPDGNTLASGCGSPSGKNAVRLWDVTTGKELGGPEGRTGYVEAVAFAPDGKMLAFGNSLGVVKLWDLAARKERLSLEATGSSSSLAYAPDGKTLVGAGVGGNVRVWDAATGKETHRFRAKSTRVHHLSYTPDGKAIILLNFNGSSIQVWEPATGQDKIVVEAAGDGERTIFFAIAPDGKTVATGTV